MCSFSSLIASRAYTHVDTHTNPRESRQTVDVSIKCSEKHSQYAIIMTRKYDSVLIKTFFKAVRTVS